MYHRGITGRFIREIVFGFEDGLISSLGIAAGLAGAALGNFIVIIGIIVQAFTGAVSMSAGTYLSTKSEMQYLVSGKRHKDMGHHIKNPLDAAFFMFVSYIIGSLVPIIPFVLSVFNQPLIPALIISIIGLFVFGSMRTIITGGGWIKNGIEMVAVGMLAFGIGYFVGSLFSPG